MICPMFVDYTRECVEELNEIIEIGDFDICQSNEYEEDCPFYKSIYKKEYYCEFVEKCPIYIHVAKKDFRWLIELTKEFCFSEKHKECQRYILRKSGKMPDINLYPDGKFLEL